MYSNLRCFTTASPNICHLDRSDALASRSGDICRKYGAWGRSLHCARLTPDYGRDDN
jgi:hypothetical protein